MQVVHLSNMMGTLKVSERNYWNRKSLFQQHVEPISFFRVGRFNVVVGHNDIAISIGYDSDDLDGLTECKGMRAGRLQVLNVARAALHRFPRNRLGADLMRAIEDETAAWNNG